MERWTLQGRKNNADFDINTILTDDQFTCLHVIANENHVEFLRVLLRKAVPEIDLNPKDKFGKTPCHYAAMRGSSAAIKVFIKQGALLNEKDIEGNTPLHHASEFGHYECVSQLVTTINPETDLKLNNFGYSPWDVAQTQAIRDLLKNANDDQSSSSKYTRQTVNGLVLKNDRIS